MQPAFHLVAKYRRSRYKTIHEFPVTAFARFEEQGSVMCLLEVYGSSEAVNRLSPSLRHRDDCQYINGKERHHVSFAKEADIQTAHSQVREGVLKTFFAPDPNNRLIPIFSNRYREIAFEISRHLFLPIMPDWAGWVVETLRSKGLLFQTDSFGIDAVTLVNNRDSVSTALSELIRDKKLRSPKTPANQAEWGLRTFAERRRDWIRRYFATRHFNSIPDLTVPAWNFLLDRSIEADQLLLEHQTGQGMAVSPHSNREALNLMGAAAREGTSRDDAFCYATTHRIAGRTFLCETIGTTGEVSFDPAQGLSVGTTKISIQP